MADSNYKFCRTCNTTLPLTEFNSDVSRGDGKRTKCRQCEKDYRERTKEKNKLRQKRYLDNHREEHRRRNEKWRRENSHLVNEWTRKWRAENPEKVKAVREKEYYKNQEKAKKRSMDYYNSNRDKILIQRYGPVPFKTYGKRLVVDDHPTCGEGDLLMVMCAQCEELFYPYRKQVELRVSTLEGRERGDCRFYCSDECRNTCSIYNQKIHPKGSKKAVTSREVQPELRGMCLTRDNHKCQICGVKENLHCHHIEGIRHNPIESADLDMVITLCVACHKHTHTLPGCSNYDLQCRPEEANCQV